ncbi:MAG: type II toxin-antitoxin system VapC family toxin [Bacteroidia bacterium]|nr:type II toxin-antitoxin system VapC family toxin [Bacteroidia bacterium]
MTRSFARILRQKNPHLARQTRFFFLVFAQNPFATSGIYFLSITEWEILAGARSKTQQGQFQKALSRYNLIELDTVIARHAGILLKTYYLSHGLLIPDALIAATALRHDLKLYTANIRDFQFIKSLQLWEPV